MKNQVISTIMHLDIDEFREFLTQRKLNEEQIRASVALLRDFIEFLKKRGKTIDCATYHDFSEYSAHLIHTGQNTYENYLAILRYGYFKHLNEIYVAAMEVLDGSEVPGNLSRRIAEEFGDSIKREIFAGINHIPLGLHPRQKPFYMRKLIYRLQRRIGIEPCAQFLNKGLRDHYEEARKPERKRFLESRNIDEFLKQTHKNLVAELEKCYKEKRLFFTQEITPKVLDFVRTDPFIESGVRHGNKIIVKKIPHMAKQYLEETDERKRKYYYCHCPWVKESLLTPDPFPPVFCNCSAGYYRAYWEIVLDLPVKVDVIESLLSGGKECRFAIHLPASVLEKI